MSSLTLLQPRVKVAAQMAGEALHRSSLEKDKVAQKVVPGMREKRLKAELARIDKDLRCRVAGRSRGLGRSGARAATERRPSCARMVPPEPCPSGADWRLEPVGHLPALLSGRFAAAAAADGAAPPCEGGGLEGYVDAKDLENRSGGDRW